MITAEQKIGEKVFCKGAPTKFPSLDGTFRMILTQGLNRQIRRMCSALGYRVQHLRRVRIINIDLGTLAPGEWRELAEAEVAALLPRRRGASGEPQAPS